MPDAYYLLTLSELDALLQGVRDRRIDAWRHTRAILTLTYNINVEKKDRKTDAEYMALEGDDEDKPKPSYIPGPIMIQLLANTFGFTVFDRRNQHES